MENKEAKRNPAIKADEDALKKLDPIMVEAVNEMISAKLNVEQSQVKNLMIANQVISDLCIKEGINISDVDETSRKFAYEQVATFNLNALAIPSECYLILRKEYKKDARGKTDFQNFKYKLQFAPQGYGYESLTRQYGVDVKKVHPVWCVKEGDPFIYPKHKGIAVTDPEWEETGKSNKTVVVVYPIELRDGSINYSISERESVKANLMAHVKNNLMYYPKEAQKIIDRINGETLDEALSDSEVISPIQVESTDSFGKQKQKWVTTVSPAWTSPQSREQMIETKMKNNALKRFPKDFSNTLTSNLYNEAIRYDDTPIVESSVIDVSADTSVKQKALAETASIKAPAPEIFSEHKEDKATETSAPEQSKMTLKQAMKESGITFPEDRKEGKDYDEYGVPYPTDDDMPQFGR